MCNACGNVCCGLDVLGGCGCDGCEDSDCWSDDNDFSERADEDDDYFHADDFRDVACAPAARRRRMICEEVRHVGC